MADLTQNVDVTGNWTEISVPLSLVDGTSYLIDAVSISSGATIEVADTDTAMPEPAVDNGHPWVPRSKNDEVLSRTFEKRSGAFVWVRVDRGTAKLIVTEVA